MKIILLLSLLFFSCAKHVDYRVPQSLEITLSVINADTSKQQFYNENNELVNSIDVKIVVDDSATYTIIVGNIELDTFLEYGAYQFSFSLSELKLADTIGVSVFVPRAVNRIDTFVVVNYLGKIYEPYLKYQWGLVPSDSSFAAQYGIDPNANIHIESVWQQFTGRGVKVAIIDESMNTQHEDLEGRIIGTYNADNETNEVSQQFGHGTTVAGVVGAAHNDKGVMGVAPNAELYLLESNSLSDASVIRAFEWAINNGIQVINCSWGSYNVSDALKTELQKVYDAGIVVVFAAGNRGWDLGYKNDESALPTVIGVGGSSEKNDYWKTSDYGDSLEVIAPAGGTNGGLGILGLDEMGSGGSSNQLGVVNENYAFVQGVSFAAPAITGVVALLLEANPFLTPAQVRDILISTADKVGGSNAHYDANGFDKYRAYGKVNVKKAIEKAVSY